MRSDAQRSHRKQRITNIVVASSGGKHCAGTGRDGRHVEVNQLSIKRAECGDRNTPWTSARMCTSSHAHRLAQAVESLSSDAPTSPAERHVEKPLEGYNRQTVSTSNIRFEQKAC